MLRPVSVIPICVGWFLFLKEAQRHTQERPQTGAEKLHWDFFSFKNSTWSFLTRLGSDAASPVKASLNNQEREERNFKHSQFSCHSLHSYITWTSSRSKPAKGFLTNFSEKLPITLRSRGTDPHPAAGVDRFLSAPPLLA